MKRNCDPCGKHTKLEAESVCEEARFLCPACVRTQEMFTAGHRTACPICHKGLK